MEFFISRVDQIERASKAWPVLIEAATSNKYLSYKDLGNAIGIHHRAVRFVLGVIQNYCLFEKLPPLTILVINSSGLPGSGFFAHDIDEFHSGVSLVRNFDWESHGNPFVFEGDSASQIEITNVLKSNPDASGEIYRKVKSRGLKQILFREALLDLYNLKCAFTCTQFIDSLEACHIKPWAESSPEEKMDVRNGILLNRMHHKLFDSHYFTLTEDHKIQFWDPKAKERKYSGFERSISVKLHGKKIHHPFKRNNRPGANYLSYHRSDFEFFD